MLHRVFKLLTLLTMHCLHCYTAWTAFTATVHAHWHLYICCYGSGALRTSAPLNDFGRSDIIFSRIINVIIFVIIINPVIIIIIINIIIIPPMTSIIIHSEFEPGAIASSLFFCRSARAATTSPLSYGTSIIISIIFSTIVSISIIIIIVHITNIAALQKSYKQ